MFMKSVKPQTHLLIDLVLFTLLLVLAFSALMSHNVFQRSSHLRFMFHALHTGAGIGLFLTVGLHLLIHLPWIRLQLKRMLKV